MDVRREQMLAFQRVVIQEVLGPIPESALDFDMGADLCDAVISCSAALAREAFAGEGERDPGFEETVCRAVSLYSLTVSAVRWNQSSLSEEEPDMPGKLLARMISETAKAPMNVKTITNELRLAPFRGPELVRYREHMRDGAIDFAAWKDASSDPVFVETIAAAYRL